MSQETDENLDALRAENERLRAEVAFLREPPVPCRFCGAKSTRLCDRRIARCIQTGEELVCSSPMCDSPACGIREDGAMFFCGGGTCDVDFSDFCPAHKDGYFGSPPLLAVSRARLYGMEKEGLGIILIKEPGPELVVVE